ncbi:hypothetical protein [Streptomyces litchfieldiae]|uniref:Secreted protein n=1 Tax=Streptomyces litchfieldiae TaxID=3075543 RepID=A0ABU2MTV8_9ACTN|nr:hypothetical protein [Streptomyces sp. DSM 44938]MDT0344273.1 hypothetical protein [Streptomyces sp. DSM 44938]
MGTLWRILLLAAAAGAWPCWRAWFYPGGPFRADLKPLRDELAVNRRQRWSAAVRMVVNRVTTGSDIRREERRHLEGIAARERAIEELKNPPLGDPVDKLGRIVLYEHVLHIVTDSPPAADANDPSREEPPPPIELPLTGLRVRSEPYPDTACFILTPARGDRRREWFPTGDHDIRQVMRFFDLIERTIKAHEKSRPQREAQRVAAEDDLKRWRASRPGVEKAVRRRDAVLGELHALRQALADSRAVIAASWDKETNRRPR